MPNAPKKACPMPGCPRLVEKGYCDEHKRAKEQRRGSAHARGYDRRWQAYVNTFKRYPESHYCACGCGRRGEQLDHIDAVSGPDDPLFYEPTNHQMLSRPCHTAKTIRFDGGYGRTPDVSTEGQQALEEMRRKARARVDAIRARGGLL